MTVGDEIDIDLVDLAIKTQARADDASEDHYYVGNRYLESGRPADLPGALCVKLDGNKEACIVGLAVSVEQTIRIWRANGGIGRGVVSFRFGDDPSFLEAHMTVLASHDDEVANIRANPYADKSLRPGLNKPTEDVPNV